MKYFFKGLFNCLNFTGYASSKEFRQFFYTALIIGSLIAFIFLEITEYNDQYLPIYLGYLIAMLLPSLAIFVRRLNAIKKDTANGEEYRQYLTKKLEDFVKHPFLWDNHMYEYLFERKKNAKHAKNDGKDVSPRNKNSGLNMDGKADGGQSPNASLDKDDERDAMVHRRHKNYEEYEKSTNTTLKPDHPGLLRNPSAILASLLVSFLLYWLLHRSDFFSAYDDPEKMELIALGAAFLIALLFFSYAKSAGKESEEP